MTRRATATTTIPKTARKKYALRSGLPRRLSALALMTAQTSGHPTAARRSIPPPEKGRQPGCYARRDDAEDPVLDLFIGRDGDAWRLYVAPTSWTPELLRRRMDERGDIFPVAAPDLADLDRVM